MLPRKEKLSDRAHFHYPLAGLVFIMGILYGQKKQKKSTNQRQRVTFLDLIQRFVDNIL